MATAPADDRNPRPLRPLARRQRPADSSTPSRRFRPRIFERALIRDPEYARAYNNLGVVLLAQGRIDAAVERFRRAARLDPRDPDALVNLALAQKAGGRTEEAKESLLRALGLAPDSAPAHYNLAVLYDRSGEARRAVEHYRAFLDHSRAEHASRAADVRARLDVLDRSR